ncbi:MAG: hypothetical protein Q9166_005536 [cf. Caloplaca sp. 2 TL-2023]
MFMFKLTALAAALATLSTVSAHGMVSGVVAEGEYYPGYTIGYAYSPSHPPMAAWSAPGDKDTGFINPGNYTNPDIICHKDATPGALYATVVAGSTVQLQWSDWPESHHGPVIDYLANCNGECTSVDKTKLKFNKIDGEGLLDYTAMPGNWASDKIHAANDSWTVTIPKSVAPGNYVLRHEIIALHSAQNPDGAQNYPQCVNLKVTGSGTDELASGTLGTELYKPDDAGILVNIYQKLTYTVPGPKLYSDTSSPSGTPTSSSGGYDSPSTPSPTTTIPSTGGNYATISPIETSSSPPSTILPPYPTPSSNSTTSPILTPAKKAGVKKPSNKKPWTYTSSTTHTPTFTSLTFTPEATGSSSPESPSTPDTTTITPSTPNTFKEGAGTSGGETEPEPETKTKTGTTPQTPTFSTMTTAELFEWLEAIVAELRSRLGSKTKRMHARDFLGL